MSKKDVGNKIPIYKLKTTKEVMTEDIKAIEGMQEGRNSPIYNGGNFSPIMDNPTHQFHKWVANNLTE